MLIKLALATWDEIFTKGDDKYTQSFEVSGGLDALENLQKYENTNTEIYDSAQILLNKHFEIEETI